MLRLDGGLLDVRRSPTSVKLGMAEGVLPEVNANPLFRHEREHSEHGPGKHQ